MLMEPYDPWVALDSVGRVTLLESDLRAGRRGQITFSTRVIELSRDLLEVERTCTLAHELVHLERGPVISRHTAREERIVASIAARRLIDLERLADALTWSTDCTELADELGVDVRTVKVRLAMLSDKERQLLAALHTNDATT